MKLNVFKIDGTESKDSVELREDVFGIVPNDQLVYEDVRSYLAAQRQGTAKTKGRVEVRGGGRKAFKQKGTGGARRGTLRSPLLKGGGTVFGPKPRTYSIRLTKKMKQIARKSALTYKAIEGGIMIVEDFGFEVPKTKEMMAVVEALKLTDKKVLLLTAENNRVLRKSASNLPKISTLEAFKSSTYEIMNTDVLLIQKSALDALQETFAVKEGVEA
ncbi:MAG: 50S ribosomal protein L4 [Balneolales bacterium]|nr:50S ribosomal protein L4 [Balneolales bacterium]